VNSLDEPRALRTNAKQKYVYIKIIILIIKVSRKRAGKTTGFVSDVIIIQQRTIHP
jgi:hypothetical protein